MASLCDSIYLIKWATNHDDEVPSGLSEDVRTRDNAGARKLKSCLSTNNNIKRITGEGEVKVGITFGVLGMI